MIGMVTGTFRTTILACNVFAINVPGMVNWNLSHRYTRLRLNVLHLYTCG